MTKIVDVLLHLLQVEVHTGKGNLNLIMVFGIIVFSRGYHVWIRKALENKYPLHLLQKHFRPILSMWVFLGLFVLFVVVCAIWLSHSPLPPVSKKIVG